MKILIITIAIILVTSVLYCISKGRMFKLLYHHILGWHIPSDEELFDGCNFHSTCRICGKEIIQDSQGNWF